MVFQLQLHPQNGSTWKNTPQKIKINNNLTYLYQKDATSKITILHILIKGGKRAEPETKKGLSYITTGLSLEIPDRGKVQKLMTLSSSILFSVYGNYCLITIKSLSENFKETMNLFSKIFSKPLFSGLRISRLKKNMIFHQKAEEDDPLRLMNLNFFNAYFKDTPYEGSVYGDKQSLKSIKTKDIKNFYNQNFNLSNMIISVFTDLDDSKITEILKNDLKKIPVGSPAQLKPIKLSPLKKKEYFIKKDKKQTLISFATLLPKLNPKNHTLAFLLDNLLGKGIGSKARWKKFGAKLSNANLHPLVFRS